MIRKRPLGLEGAKQCLIDAEVTKKSVHSEQFKRDMSKLRAAEDMVKRCATKGVFYKDPEWNWKQSEWTYFVEDTWRKISFTVTVEGAVILKSIRETIYNPQITAAPPPEPKCPHTAEEAIKLLRLAQAASKVGYTDHCRERLSERLLCEAEVQNCIAVGIPHKRPEWDPYNKEWTYSIDGAGLRLFFSVEFGEAVLITLYVPDPEYRHTKSPLD